MKKQNGFTLIEVMIVVAIVAILGAIALPAYSDYLLRGKLTEAHATLLGTRTQVEQFFQDNRTYVGFPCVAPNTKYFTYACALAATTYTITATGVDAEGLNGFAFTIDQNNTRATTITGVAATGGYTSSATCWIRKKPNQC